MAGFIQGQSWAAGVPEVNVLPLLHPWFIARAVFGAMIVLSGIVQMVNIYLTVRGDTASRLARGVERVAGRPLVAGGTTTEAS
jgi:hypothetical protein